MLSFWANAVPIIEYKMFDCSLSIIEKAMMQCKMTLKATEVNGKNKSKRHQNARKYKACQSFVKKLHLKAVLAILPILVAILFASTLHKPITSFTEMHSVQQISNLSISRCSTHSASCTGKTFVYWHVNYLFHVFSFTFDPFHPRTDAALVPQIQFAQNCVLASCP